jgi:hypothetical protein
MGTAQLLYITLGVIIVGLAIVTGMDMFNTYMQENTREQLINHSLTILSKAEEYYKKPVDLGGGGGSYQGFTLPSDLTRNELGRFKINLAANKNRVNINARGDVTGNDGENPVRIIARITRNNRNPNGLMQILIRN